MSPKQAEVLEHMQRADCPLLWWQATHGIRRARFDTVRALFGAGLIVRHPAYSTAGDDLAGPHSYLIVSAKGEDALRRLRAKRVHAENMRQIERVGALVHRVVGAVR